MKRKFGRAGHAFAIAAGAALMALAAAPAQAQAPTSEAGQSAAAPGSPYYVGASQGFTHDSNVYRIPSGPDDNYSSTGLFAGFDVPLSRQRLFGRARADLNRYQREKRLDNTSYDLTAGLNWETIENLSGNVTATLDQHLAAPAAIAAVPQATRNLADRRGVSGLARWGGVSVFTVEGTLGYSTLDYSAPEYVSAESKQEYGSIGLFYKPSPPLRVGIAVRLDRTRTPKAFLQADGSYLPNQINGRHLDLIGEYELSSRLSANARASYTRQTNSSAGEADFSGFTGDIRVTYRPTAKIGLSGVASHQAGFDASQVGTGLAADAVPTPATPIAGLYENNRVTDSFGLSATYAATAKITGNAGVSYTRARILSTVTTGSGSTARPDVVDTVRGATLGASYAISRPWLLACNLGYEKRFVVGEVSYSYEAGSVGCSAQFAWR